MNEAYIRRTAYMYHSVNTALILSSHTAAATENRRGHLDTVSTKSSVERQVTVGSCCH